MSNTKNNRAWCFASPAWYDHAKENEENEWWDPARREWRPMGTIRITLAERRQACHAEAFAQWASHELAESAPQRGYEACRRAVMRLVAAWGEYGVYTKLEDMILDAWYRGEYITDEELAEEARAFGYSRIADILDPVGEQDEDGGVVSMHKRVHW